MTGIDPWARLNRLGYITQTQVAEVLGTKQYNISRYLSGARPWPPELLDQVKALQTEHPAILTPAMAEALDQANGPQEAIEMPRGEVHHRAIDWPATFDAMHRLGVVRQWQGQTVVTTRGWKALQEWKEG